MTMRCLAMLLTAFVVAIAGYAGDLPKQCIQVAELTQAPRLNTNRGAAAQIDQAAVCHQDRARIENSIAGLRSQIATAKSQLSQIVGLRFQCVDGQTSANNKGIAEDCSPNACAPSTGRCVNEVHSTEDCAAGYVWDSGTGNCVNPMTYNSGSGN